MLNIIIFSLVDEIFAKIEEAGFEVAMSKELVLSKEEAELFYQEHKEKDFFDSLCSHMARYEYLILSLWFIFCYSNIPVDQYWHSVWLGRMLSQNGEKYWDQLK